MNYCQSLSDRALTHETRSQFMNAALYFTQHTYKNTRKEYRRFVKDEALKLYQEIKDKYFESMQYQTIDKYIERATTK